ncbi:RHS repeat-associated core domain-containing protein [Salinibius halmophilus]|uniref:RHS repeat-associated core domain-containing protein n=1 Tax=Salinibius halmophilus TaxID=1853216 RepID=UPI000E6742C4|nr:RHS repeat-associated core domain-containing protein [Salinibius halmophilus]
MGNNNWVEGDYLTTYTPYCRYHCPVYERARYGDVAYSEPKQVTNSGAIVVEDMSSLATYTGNWSQHTTSDQPPARGATGASYKSASNTAGTQVRYNLPMTGEYGIYVSMPTRYGLDTQARVRVAENGTTLDAGKVFNSAAYGDEWIYIGDYNLTNGNAFLVLDSANPGTYKTLASDAILLLPKGQQPQYATAKFTHATTQEGLHTVELVFANDHVGGSNVPVTVEYTNQAGQQVSRQFTANFHSSNNEQFTSLATLPDVRANTNISVTLSSKTNGYVYADAIRVKSGGEAGPSSLYFVHNDHIATPEAITDAAGNLVWQRHTTPFGDHMPQAVSGFLGEQQGFPGQHFDDTTGLSYNYFRDYDPTTGRYIQSDPIGLNGGLNTYGYVGGNPLGYVDPLGLSARDDLSEAFNAWKQTFPSPAGYWEAVQAMKDARAAAADVDTYGMTPAQSNYQGPADAIRHCVLACSLTQRLGREAAINILDYHERNESFNDEMDRQNNLMGCFIGEQADVGSCHQSCLENIDNLLTYRGKEGLSYSEPRPIGSLK